MESCIIIIDGQSNLIEIGMFSHLTFECRDSGLKWIKISKISQSYRNEFLRAIGTEIYYSGKSHLIRFLPSCRGAPLLKTSNFLNQKRERDELISDDIPRQQVTFLTYSALETTHYRLILSSKTFKIFSIIDVKKLAKTP